MISALRFARLGAPARRQSGALRLLRGAVAVMAIALGFASAPARAFAESEGSPILTNLICPVMTDQEVDPEIWVEHEGQRVYLCCQKCRRLFEADPAKYAPNLVLVSSSPQAASAGDQPAAPTSRAPRPPAKPTVAERIGRWHVAALHFPVALLLSAGLVEVARPRNAPGGLAALRVLLGLGAAGAVVAAGLGLLLEESVGRRSSGDPGRLQLLEWHKWAGIASAAIAVAAAALLEIRARRSKAIPAALTTGAVLLAAAAVGLSGHFGGQLVWGRDFLIPW